jgi:hypothetical protein
MFKELNVEAVICNQNALADERLFDVIPDSPKEYDAIYNARIAPYKRHYLATRIASLALLARLPPPGFVRRKTLRRMGEYRAILIDVICRIFAKEGMQLDAGEALSRLFPEQIYKLRPLHHILSIQ